MFQKANSTTKKLLFQLYKSVWLFPAILTLILLVLTIFQINGSSSGSYQSLFFGGGKDSNVLLNQPRPIRSDEWLVTTQIIVAQASNGFQRINENIADGQDMSLIVDVPYKEWSTIFKPHNIAFFIMPFDNAFAFRWWFMAYLLLLGCYFFVVSLWPTKRLIASLAALTLFFSPFVQWWYLYGTLGSLAWSLFGGAVFIRLLQTRRRWQVALWSLCLTYILVAFVLIFYPPFQIPSALVMASFGLAYGFLALRKLPRKEILEKLVFLAGAGLAATALIGAFWFSHRQVIKTVKQTAYPGVRNIVSGEYGGAVRTDYGLLRTFSAPLSFGLQDEQRGASYYANQSEAATFTLINLMIAPFVLLAIYKKPSKQRTTLDYVFVATSILLGLFIIRIFTPFFSLPFKFLLLHQVQNERLEIGLILLCLIQIVLLGAMRLTVSRLTAGLAAVIGLGFFANASFIMARRYPLFAPAKLTILLIVAVVTISIYWLLRTRTYIWGMALFAAFNMFSSLRVNPLYAEPQSPVVSRALEHIKTRYPDNQTWAVFDQLITENFPQMAGKPALTGVHTYPQLDIWQTIDSAQPETTEYNRYAHVIFTAGSFPDGEQFTNPQADVLMVSFNCELAKKLPNFGHVLSTPPIDITKFQCLRPDGVLDYQGYQLYFYKYQPV